LSERPDEKARSDAALMRVTSTNRSYVLRRLDESRGGVLAKIETIIGIVFLVMVLVVIVNVIRQ